MQPTGKHSFSFIALTLAILLGAARVDSFAASDEDGFVSLFDGKSLDGWKRFGGKAEAWAVQDGLLVSLGEGGGWLGTDKTYADFVFRFDFRLTPDSNSGIYLRAPSDTSHISRTGMEIQLLDEYHPKYKKIQPWQKTGSIYHVAAAEPGHLKKAGEWNSMEIRAEGKHVVITLNGAKVVDDMIDKHPELDAEHTGLKRRDGRVGLQSHNGRVEFRGIKIKELNKK